MTAPCPICFEIPEESQIMTYAAMSNHSWRNSTLCDAHGICRRCMARYVEIQILEEGHFNPRCPGEGCRYRLVPLDVERSLEWSKEKDKALERFERLRSECHEGRLKEILSQRGDTVTEWLLSECQPCPRCLTLVRREEGCLHVFCRCGCDFCFGCGGPDPEGCICHYMEKPRELVFAAWLRTSPESPFEWLWDNRKKENDEERFLTTLHFWLWMARAVPAPWASDAGVEKMPEYVQGLEPIKWRSEGGGAVHEDFHSIWDDCVTDIEGDEEDDAFGPFYPRVPQKPMRRHVPQRQSRREDRHGFQALRWQTVRVEGGQSRETMAVPLQPQRQPRAVAVQTRSARRRARQVETRSRRGSNSLDLED